MSHYEPFLSSPLSFADITNPLFFKNCINYLQNTNGFYTFSFHFSYENKSEKYLIKKHNFKEISQGSTIVDLFGNNKMNVSHIILNLSERWKNNSVVFFQEHTYVGKIIHESFDNFYRESFYDVYKEQKSYINISCTKMYPIKKSIEKQYFKCTKTVNIINNLLFS